MNEQVLIRQYRDVDREHVRRICYETADAGHSAQVFFADRDIFSDAVTRYYTDFQGDSLWVAESAGRVVGYLCGCFDTVRYNRIMTATIIPRIFLKACVRGLFFRRYFWRIIRGMMITWVRGGYNRPSFLAAYPAHMHIDIEADFRAHGIGRLLMESFFTQARAHGICGIHLSTRQDNPSACVFFEKLGFRVLGRYPVVFPHRQTYKESAIVIYGVTL